MNILKTIHNYKFLFLFAFCALVVNSYANRNDTISYLESQIEILKSENDHLRHDIEQLENSQYQSIRQYHDDMSSELSTYMTWVGVLAALLTIIVALVSILIPIRINNGFETRIKDWFSDFRDDQKTQLETSLNELECWKKNLMKEQKSRFDKVMSDVSNLKKDAKQSERKAWISQTISEAISAINEKEFDRSIMLCDQILKMDSGVYSAYNLKGIAYAEKKDYDKAIENFDKAIEINPNNSGYIYNRAKIKYQLKQYQEALEDCDIAISLDSTKSDFYTLRAATKREKGDDIGALADISKSIELAPNDAKGYFNRGVIKKALGKVQGALEDFFKYLELDPSNAAVYNSIAYVYLELGQNDLAYSYVEKAILLTEEKDGRYIDTRGEVLMTMGKLNDALNDFTRASILMPKESEPFEHRALCYRKLAEKEQDSGKQAEWIAKAEADEEKAELLKKDKKI